MDKMTLLIFKKALISHFRVAWAANRGNVAQQEKKNCVSHLFPDSDMLFTSTAQGKELWFKAQETYIFTAIDLLYGLRRDAPPLSLVLFNRRDITNTLSTPK